MAAVRLEGVTVRRGGVAVLDGLDLVAPDGELLALVGPSGAGKSTVLRVIAGVEGVDEGSVFIGDDEVTARPPSGRRVAMVFQDDVSIPNRTVRGNIAFPLEIAGTAEDAITRRVEAEARVLEIERLLEKRPGRLSAGHRQLVQAARALVRVPAVFLLDEPLARLDAHVRVRVRRELRLLQQGYAVTTVFVTNDAEEAMAIADRMAVLDGGRVIQVGTPLEVYRRPVDRTVARLVGSPPMPIVHGRVAHDPPGYRLFIGPLSVRAWSPALGVVAGRDVEVGVRPESVVTDSAGATAEVAAVTDLGSSAICTVMVGDGTTLLMRSTTVPPRVGDRLHVGVTGLHVFDPVTGRAVAHVEASGSRLQ